MVEAAAVPPYPPIGDYALIGNCRTAGLVSRDGSLDWLCWPRFDSPSVFGALLDQAQGGRFRVRPVGAFESQRRYLPDTNVLETTFHTASGSVVLRDCLTVSNRATRAQRLQPAEEVLRMVEGHNGEVTLEVLFEPRPDYARAQPRLRDLGRLGLRCQAGAAEMILVAEMPLQLSDDRCRAVGTVVVKAGQSVALSLVYAHEGPAVLPVLGQAARSRLAETSGWWRTWSERCTYQGPYREAVQRSALALKLMTYAPSGAVIAAPTTSLPERIGGERNWDYRFCWLRDASLTLHALFMLGYQREGTAFLSWMVQATRLTWPRLQVVYDLFGEARLPEHTLPHLDGYRGSRPVRTGNGAHSQLQLDVYGAVAHAVAGFAAHGGEIDPTTARLLADLGGTVCDLWQQPDSGIWEERAAPQHHTFSKAMCWVALDSLVRTCEMGNLDLDLDRFRHERDAIREAVETRGFNTSLGAYTRTFDGDDLDASLLQLPYYGYLPATHPRMRSTLEQTYRSLAQGSLLRRYAHGTADGLPAGEGAFGICSFWAAACRARSGDLDGARAAFEDLLACANDVGLYAEEINPADHAALGNFPQAFTHVGLIDAALAIAEQLREAPAQPVLTDQSRQALTNREKESNHA